MTQWLARCCLGCPAVFSETLGDAHRSCLATITRCVTCARLWSKRKLGELSRYTVIREKALSVRIPCEGVLILSPEDTLQA